MYNTPKTVLEDNVAEAEEYLKNKQKRQCVDKEVMKSDNNKIKK